MVHLPPGADAAAKVQELRLHGGFRQQKDYGEVLRSLADQALWRQSYTLLLEMRFRSMPLRPRCILHRLRHPFPSTCALAALACYKASHYEARSLYLSFRMCSQEAAHIMKKLWSALPRQLDCIDCGAVLSRFQHFGSSRERDATKEARPLARRPGFLRGDAAPANRSRCLRLQQCNWAGAGLGFCVWCGEVMAASRQVNDFWVAPEILQSMKEKEVQPDAWSYSQAMDASNAVQNWEKALEHLGSKLHK